MTYYKWQQGQKFLKSSRLSRVDVYSLLGPRGNESFTVVFFLLAVLPVSLWAGEVGISPVDHVEVDCRQQPEDKNQEDQRATEVERHVHQDAHFCLIARQARLDWE